MQTNFFQYLASIHDKAQWNMTIHIDNGHIVTSTVVTVGDNEPTHAIIFDGTIQEYDSLFFSQLSIPVEKTKEFFSNSVEYFKQLEDAKQQLADKQVKINTPNANGKTDAQIELKRVYTERLKEIAKLTLECKYSEALALLPNKVDYPDKAAEIDKLSSDLTWKSKQLPLSL